MILLTSYEFNKIFIEFYRYPVTAFIKNKIFLFIVLIFLNFINSFSIGLYPTNFDKNIFDTGASESYYIRNESDEIKIYTIDIDMENKSIEKIFFPRKFILGVGESREVKVFMKSSEKNSMGYTGNLLVVELPLRINLENNIQKNVKIQIKAYSNERRENV
ncbi:MAG: hypothetical protein ACRCZ2_09390 [Fusobacteriaceae bacterium]